MDIHISHNVYVYGMCVIDVTFWYVEDLDAISWSSGQGYKLMYEWLDVCAYMAMVRYMIV
jgi:hypothetical protein